MGEHLPMRAECQRMSREWFCQITANHFFPVGHSVQWTKRIDPWIFRQLQALTNEPCLRCGYGSGIEPRRNNSSGKVFK